MLGPMVNPSFPKRQLVGVFSLELARMYGYLYQKTDKDFVVLHSLDGYDEISLTGSFKMISQESERIIHPHEIGLQSVQPEQLSGGKTIEDSAKVFINILSGKGTKAQNEAVIANAGTAIYCGKGLDSLEDGINEARESLVSGRAFETFKKLVKNEQRIYSLN